MPLQICRFCLEENGDKENPMIKPCKCKGSMAFVHKDCIKIWRRSTTIPKNVTHCQLCLGKFKLPTLIPLETIPEEIDSESWKILSNTFLIWTTAIMSNQLLIVVFNSVIEQTTNQSHLFFPNELNDRIYYISNSFTICTISTCYIHFYTPYFNAVNNKKMYCKQWISDWPCYFLLMTLLSLCLSIISQNVMYPVLYIFFLPKFMYVHTQILTKMNRLIV